MFSRPFGLAIAALGSACGSGAGALELPPEASQYGVAVRVDTNGVETYAYVDSTDSPNLIDPPIEGWDVGLLFYAATLDELELIPGRVYPNEGRYKSPDGARVLEGVGADGASWRTFPPRGLPAWIEPYRLAGVCRSHRVKPINLPPLENEWDAHDVTGFVSIDEDNVLISTLEGRFFRATWQNDAAPRVTELAVTGVTDAFLGGFRSPTRLWFGGPGGLLAATSLEASRDGTELHFEEVAKLPGSELSIERAVLDIDGDPEREDDVFALTLDGSVLHFDGSRLSTLGQIAGTSTTRISLLDTREVRWSGPQRAVAVTWVRRGEYPIFDFAVGESPRPLVLPGQRERSPSAVSLGPSGLFVATTLRNDQRGWESQIWLLPPGSTEWLLYSESTLGVFGMVIERYEALVVGVGAPFTGMLASQAEGVGPECMPTLASSPLRDVLRTGPHAAVAVGHSFGFGSDANQLLWVR